MCVYVSINYPQKSLHLKHNLFRHWLVIKNAKYELSNAHRCVSNFYYFNSYEKWRPCITLGLFLYMADYILKPKLPTALYLTDAALRWGPLNMVVSGLWDISGWALSGAAHSSSSTLLSYRWPSWHRRVGAGGGDAICFSFSRLTTKNQHLCVCPKWKMAQSCPGEVPVLSAFIPNCWSVLNTSPCTHTHTHTHTHYRRAVGVGGTLAV